LKKRLITYTPNILLEVKTGFSEGRNCTGPIYTLEQITAKLEKFNASTFSLFIHYKQFYIRMNRPTVWGILKFHGIFFLNN
jgi:hypothetical protein